MVKNVYKTKDGRIFNSNEITACYMTEDGEIFNNLEEAYKHGKRKYKVTFTLLGTFTETVEAQDEEEAKKIAWDECWPEYIEWEMNDLHDVYDFSIEKI